MVSCGSGFEITIELAAQMSEKPRVFGRKSPDFGLKRASSETFFARRLFGRGLRLTALRGKQLEEICHGQQLFYARCEIPQHEYAQPSAYGGDLEPHDGSETRTVHIFKICKIKRDAASPQDERMDNFAEFSRVFTHQSAPALDDRDHKIVLVPGFLDLVLEGSAGWSRHKFLAVEFCTILNFQRLKNQVNFLLLGVPAKNLECTRY